MTDRDPLENLLKKRQLLNWREWSFTLAEWAWKAFVVVLVVWFGTLALHFLGLL